MTTTAVRERPILFTGPMVRAILDGKKTQTRRVLDRVLGIGKVTEFGASDTIGYDYAMRDRRMLWNELRTDDLLARSPYGQPGDLLYVRETWAEVEWSDGNGHEGSQVLYRADGHDHRTWRPEAGDKWRPSIFMPKAFARLWLRVTDVRVERVQDISEADAGAEGVNGGCVRCGEDEPCGCPSPEPDCRESFIHLWDSINANRGYGWGSNPWVWAVSFERVER